jgi:hypothetical protein
MRSAFARAFHSAAADSLRQMACQPKLSGLRASEGWTTEMFVEAIYNALSASRKTAKWSHGAGGACGARVRWT